MILRCLLLAVALLTFANAQKPEEGPYRLSESERRELRTGYEQLGAWIAKLRGRYDEALLAEVEIYHKALDWLLRYEEELYNKNYLAHARRVIEDGTSRAAELEAGRHSWTTRTGRVIRAYRSRIDGSIQPFGMVIPAGYDRRRPMRLDVILHGRNATLSEVSFLATHGSSKTPDPQGRLELHVFGRTNNAYRWGGEADVFEALASARSRYAVDPDRIVLRGFSMGGAGAWHLGLHYPGRWAAVEAGAGFTETKRYARLTSLTPDQEKLLHIYDAVDYSLNAWNLPIVGYGGELDRQLQASVNIKEQLAAEGISLDLIKALFLVGPKTEHKWHPESKEQSERFIKAVLENPRGIPERVRFVTYTTKYNRSHWVTIEGLERHYERAEVDARLTASGVSVRTRNVSRLRLPSQGDIEIDGQVVTSNTGVLEKRDGRWQPASNRPALRKRHGLQGPIDDAFMGPFLCVAPTGGSPALDRFRREYAKWMRADVPVKDASAVTEDDLRTRNLILFGTPETNPWIAKVMPRLPLSWPKEKDQLLALIYPNPLNPNRYVVLNSGHTFGESDFKGTNALLYPRLGDWAILDAEGKPIRSGFFDEAWKPF